MTFGSLFAGIGGFDLGFERAGMRCAWQVELEPTCRAVLARHFPSAARFDDVRAVGASTLVRVDVICGGFPCQDLSVAGRRAGLVGERSGLFYEMARVAHEVEPAAIVWENVPGLLSSNSGRDFAAVLVELERVGYSGGWTTVDARYFGLAQRRRRVFGVFARGSLGAEFAAEVLALAPRLLGNPAPGRPEGKDVAGTFAGAARGGGFRLDLDGAGAYVPAGVADPVTANEGKTYTHEGSTFRVRNVVPTLTAKMAKGTGGPAGHETQNLVRSDRGVRRLMPVECERLQGFPDGWTEFGEPGYDTTLRGRRGSRGIPGGLSDSIRYRMLGNAVPPPCTAWIGRRLVANMGGVE